jgi:signal transduction histidine kinase
VSGFVFVLLAKTLRSSTLRLALLYIALLSAALLGLFGYLYWSTLSYIHHRQDSDIAREHALMTYAFAQGGRSALIGAIERRISGRRFDGWTYLLSDGSSAPVGNLSQWPPALRGEAGRGVFMPEEYPESTIRAEFETLPNGSRLLTGQVDSSGGVGRAIGTGVAVAIALIILLAAAAGISTSRRSVTRIETINAISRDIMRSGLGRRVPRRGTEDEWDELADNLNAMLDRIEELVEANRQVSDNIAHDLRTPLMRIRGRLELAFNQPVDPNGHQALLGETITELDGVLRIFSSLLRISQIEAQHRRASFHSVNLAALAGEVVELFEPAAEEKGVPIELHTSGDISILGDRDLLFDAVSNLIDNAIKHGAGLVTVTVGRANDLPIIEIADRGPGVPGDEQKNVLKRFYRLEQSRHSPGSGLGLSLVAAIAHLHGAAVRMTDNAPGLKIELDFPTPPSVSL